jgi:hypothetical protein
MLLVLVARLSVTKLRREFGVNPAATGPATLVGAPADAVERAGGWRDGRATA